MPDLLTRIDEELLVSYSDVAAWKQTDCMHFHNSYELVLGVHAENECFLRDTGYPFVDRTLFFVPAQQMHIIKYKTEVPYARYVVNFADAFIRQTLTAMGCPGLLEMLSSQNCLCVQLTPQQYSPVQQMVHAVYRAFRSGDSAQARGWLSLLLMETARLLQEGELPALRQVSAPEKLVREAVRWLDENYAQDVALEQLAARLFVSKYYLSHVFREVTGSGVIDYLQCRRILEAQKLLMRGGLDNQQVAVRCGFHNMQHFYRVFRRVSGDTPGQYRLPEET